MIYFQLFWQFLKIGAVSFGGGYGMISLIREAVLTNNWLTESEFLAFIAVSESTPGPLAVNMATFIGASQGGVLGAFLATLGVISPAFIIILVIVSCIKNLLKYAGVKTFLDAVRPCVVALILATAVTMGLSVFCGIKQISDSPEINYSRVFIFLIVSSIGIVAKKMKQKTPSPILMILVSACLGIVVNLIP
ncbi:MAG: chromate transporter [Lachnospiraceae bacterium]|nr:chromate transporter [Lachnospiraceae bacterium]